MEAIAASKAIPKPAMISDMPYLALSESSIKEVSEFIEERAHEFKPIDVAHSLVFRSMFSLYVRHFSVNQLFALAGAESIFESLSEPEKAKIRFSYQGATRLVSDKQAGHTHIKQSVINHLGDLKSGNLAGLATGGIGKAVKLAINARMGTGKTQHVGVPFADMCRGMGITPLFVAHRIGLMRELSTRTNTVNYQEVTLGKKTKPEIDALNIREHGLSVCVNSLANTPIQTQIKSLNGNYALFIDEVWQVFRSLATTKDKKKRNMLDMLITLIKNAKALIVADADLNDYCLNMLNSAIGETMPVYYAERDVSDIRFNMNLEHDADTSSTHSLMAQAVKFVKDGNKCVIYSDRIRVVQTISKMINLECGDKVRTIEICEQTKESAEVKRFVSDANKHSHEYDVILVSPSITSGISIENPDFKTAFAFYNGSTITHADAIQQLARCRLVRTFNIALSTLPKDYGEKVFRDEHYKEAFKSTSYDLGVLDSDTKLAELVAKCQELNNESNENFAQMFMLRIVELGYDVKITAKSVHALPYDEKQIRKEIIELERIKLLESEDLDYKQAAALKQKHSITDSEYFQLKRFDIKQVLGMGKSDELKPEYLDLFSGGFGVGAIRRNGIVFDFIDNEYMNDQEIEDHVTTSMRRFPIETHELAHKALEKIFGRPVSLATLMMDKTLTFRNSQLKEFSEFVESNALTGVVVGLFSHRRLTSQIRKKGDGVPLFIPTPIKETGMAQAAKDFFSHFGLPVKSIGRVKIPNEEGKITKGASKEHLYGVDVKKLVTMVDLGRFQMAKTEQIRAKKAERLAALESLKGMGVKTFEDMSDDEIAKIKAIATSVRDENDKAKELGWGWMCPKCKTSTASYVCPTCGHHELTRVQDLAFVSDDELERSVFYALSDPSSGSIEHVAA